MIAHMFKWIERRDYRGWLLKEPGPQRLDDITAAKKEAAEIMSGCQGPDAPAYVQAKAIWDLLDDQFQITLAKEVRPMPRRAAQPPQPPEIRQFRTTAEIDSTIVKLKRRIGDQVETANGQSWLSQCTGDFSDVTRTGSAAGTAILEARRGRIASQRPDVLEIRVVEVAPLAAAAREPPFHDVIGARGPECHHERVKVSHVVFTDLVA